MADTSFLGFGYQPSQVEPPRIVANVPKGQTATDKVRQWLQRHPGFHAIADISDATQVPTALVNSAISNLYQRNRIQRETERRARGLRGQPQRYAWRVQ